MHADAAVGDEAADRLRCIRAMDRVFTAGQGHCRRAHRIARRTAGDHRRQGWLIAPYILRRRPGGLDVFPADEGLALPLHTFLSDADWVADRTPVIIDVIKPALA